MATVLTLKICALTDIFADNFLTRPDLQVPTQKKIKKKATARKIFAAAHCTHLSLPADTQAQPKAKSKECNRQRFKSHS